MAVSYLSSGAYTTATATSITLPIGAGAAAGDMMIAMISIKAYNSAISTPSGWTSLGLLANGTTASGTGTGSVKVQAFYKEHTGTETNPSFTLSAPTTIAIGIIQVYRKTFPLWLDPVGAGQWQVPNSTTLNFSTNVEFPMYVTNFFAGFCATNSNTNTFVTFSSLVNSSTSGGGTFSAFTTTPSASTQLNTSLGAGLSMVSGYASVTAEGSRYAFVDFSGNTSISSDTIGFVIRLAESYIPGTNDPFSSSGFFN